MNRIAFTFSLCCAALCVPAWSQTPAELAAAAPQPMLRQEYHPHVRKTLEYIGFSFGGPGHELEAMREAGANAVGHGEMWMPVREPEAPYGVCVAPPPGVDYLAQTFTAHEPFDGFAPHLPTSETTDSGCSWRLMNVDGETVARGVWENVEDNSWPEARFDEQPPGVYAFFIKKPTGSWIGWWLRVDHEYPGGSAYRDQTEIARSAFECRVRSGGEWENLVPSGDPHEAVRLAEAPYTEFARHGLSASFQIGNWNNPGFNYYPEWFMENHPEAIAHYANGDPVMGGGMFDREVPVPNIESAVIVNGTRRFLESRARETGLAPNLLFWVLGGEELYPTYMSGRWADYSDNSIAHFRAWLSTYRYDSIAELNAAWGTDYAAFGEVEPPREPDTSIRWLDWLDFRFASMGERLGWVYQALREHAPGVLSFTCNHGTLYHQDSYAAMGADIWTFGMQSDGYETGQIIKDADPDYYNLLYTESILPMGKPYAPVRLAYAKSDPTARGGSTSYTPEAARRYGYESLGAGAWFLGYIQWSGSLPDGEWGVVGTPGEEAISRFFGQVRELWPLLEDLHPVRPETGVLWSHRTWALLGFQDPWHAFHKAAIHHQLPKSYLYDGHVRHGLVDAYPVLVSMDNTLMDPRTVDALADYVDRGGRLYVMGDLGGGEGVAEALAGREGAVRFEGTPEELAARLGRDHGPVRVSSDVETTRLVQAQTLELHNTPSDMSGVKLGQTVTVEMDGLVEVAISNPTYGKQATQGFTVEARLGGPDGEVVARRDIEPPYGDNSWNGVRFDEAPAAGTILYVAAYGDGLPEQHVGWWGHTGDVYAKGRAFVGGLPVQGDRKVRMTYEAPVNAARAVESFALSDGLNVGVVLINTSATEVVVDVEFPVLEAMGGVFEVSCPLTPDAWDAGTVRIGPSDGVFLWCERKLDETALRTLVAEAAAAIAAWGTADALTPHAEYLAETMEECIDTGRTAKAAAKAVRILAAAGIAVECPGHLAAGESTTLVARFLDAAGELLTPDRAWAEFTPANGLVVPLEARGDGKYAIEVGHETLPPLYNYAYRAYEPFHGALRVRVAALLPDGREVSRLWDVEVAGPRRPAPHVKRPAGQGASREVTAP